MPIEAYSVLIISTLMSGLLTDNSIIDMKSANAQIDCLKAHQQKR
jgi:hypothetical protein